MAAFTVRGTVKGYYEKDDFSTFLQVDGGKAVSPQLINDSQVTGSGSLWVVKKASSITP